MNEDEKLQQNADAAHIEMIDDGGPAFPGEYVDHYIATDGVDGPSDAQAVFKHGSGMSLRDWFAGMALQAIIGNDGLLDQAARHRSGIGARDSVGITAYDFADSMLAARKK